jgi:hypothetical protein
MGMKILQKSRQQGLFLIILSYVIALVDINAFHLQNDARRWPLAAVLLMTASTIASFGGSYLYVKSKGRHGRWALIAFFGLVGHISMIYLLKDYKRNVHGK